MVDSEPARSFVRNSKTTGGGDEGWAAAADDKDAAAGVEGRIRRGREHMVHDCRSPSSGENQRALLAHTGVVSSPTSILRLPNFQQEVSGPNLGTTR
jgi:hypothetical protein